MSKNAAVSTVLVMVVVLAVATLGQTRSDRLKALIARSDALLGKDKKDPYEESSNFQIQNAIANPSKYAIYCQASAGFWKGMGDAAASGLAGRRHYSGDYIVIFASNLGLIGMAAHQARQRYEAFDLEDVDPSLYKPSMTLLIQPTGGQMGNVAAAGQIKHTVIRRRKTKREDVIQPKSVKLSPEVYSNLFGAQFVSSSAIVEFDHLGVLDIASRGDVEAVVITTAGERRCWVDNAKIVEMFR